MAKTSTAAWLARALTWIIDRREFMLIYIIVLAVIGLWHAAPHFLGPTRISADLLSLSNSSIIAIGMTILLVSGAFDLSVGSTLALSGAVTAIWINSGLPIPLAIALGLSVGVLIGLINGLIITKIGINPFITTLGMMSLVRGLVLVVLGGKTISGLPASFTQIGQGKVWGIQYPILISLALVVVGHLLLSKSRFIRHNY